MLASFEGADCVREKKVFFIIFYVQISKVSLSLSQIRERKSWSQIKIQNDLNCNKLQLLSYLIWFVRQL